VRGRAARGGPAAVPGAGRGEAADRAALHHFGKEGPAAHHATDAKGGPADIGVPPLCEQPESTLDPGRLALWTEFHQRVEELPDAVRAVFELVWYQELPQDEVAQLLHISVPTVKRRLVEARVRLMDLLEDAEAEV
jgi:RNA polymerase sigma-70 factor (ECF subfamily)